MPKDGACNLGSMNLSAYVINPFTSDAHFDMKSFANDVDIAIQSLDEVLDEGMNLHALESQRQMAHDFRNVGLGIMGLGDMFFKLGIKYGCEESKKLLDSIMYLMFRSAVKSSAKQAKEKGSFPKYSDKVYDSTIIKNHFSKEEIKELRKMGLRNCSLLSIAPSGSIGTMLDVTTGIEPAFELSYQRKTESLHKDQEVYYDVFISSAKEYLELNKTNRLPDYFVTAKDIHWKDRIDIQAIAQNHVDTAISSTVNLPKDISIEEVEQLYLYAWEQGLKGVTIFREGCKRGGILKSNSNSEDEDKSEKYTYEELPRGYIEDVPNYLVYRKYKLKTGCGNLYFFVGVDELDGKIYDCFTNTDGVGGCTVNTQANSRLLSAALRGGVPVEYLADQLNKSGTCPSFQYKKGKGQQLCKGKSCPSALANILKDIMEERKENQDDQASEIKIETKHEPKLKVKTTQTKVITDKNGCPECGEKISYEGGCNVCKICGYSKCE